MTELYGATNPETFPHTPLAMLLVIYAFQQALFVLGQLGDTTQSQTVLTSLDP